MVTVPARSMLPMIAFRDAPCITHNPVDGTVSQGREGPARFAGCRITLRTRRHNPERGIMSQVIMITSPVRVPASF